MICIFGQSDKIFLSNGDHILKANKAMITKEDNADYYIEIEAPLKEIEWLQEGRITAADTPWGRQGFRLTNPKVKNNKVIIKGKHVYFDAERYVISDSYVVDKNGNEAINHINEATDQESPFAVSSDLINTVGTARVVRKTLKEAVDILQERWGGHIDRDNYTIALNQEIGQDRGVVISYAKNLAGLTIEENWKEVATKIMPVGRDGIKLPEEYLYGEMQYEIPYTKVIKIDQDLNEDDYPNEESYKAALIEDLRKQGKEYLETHALPECTYNVKAALQNVADVGDIIRVIHPKIPVDLITNVTAVKWNCLTERYESVTFGTKPKKLSSLTANIEAANDKITIQYEQARDELTKKLKEATAKIWGAMSDSHVIYDGDKILIVDKLPKEEAKNCILINAGGFGFSKKGINGEFNSAWTIDGTLDMQAINVLNLTADMIKTGTLDASLVKIKNLIKAINEETGEEKISGTKVIVNGEEVTSVVEKITKTQANTITEITDLYAKGESESEAPVEGWTEAAPEREEGKYIWKKTIIKKTSGEEAIRDPVCITGFDGMPGEDALLISLSSESHSFSDAESTVRVVVSAYKGTEKVAATIGEISGLTDGITAEIRDNNTKSATISVKKEAEIEADEGVIVIPVTSEGESTEKNWSWATNRRGKDAVIYTIECISQAIIQSFDGKFEPERIGINGLKKVGSSIIREPYEGRFIVEETSDNEEYTVKYTSTKDEAGISYTPSNPNVKAIRASLYAAGGTKTLLEQILINVIRDGTPSTTVKVRSTSGTIFQNGKGTLSLIAEGKIGNTVISEGAAYQWYKNDNLLDGETENTYTAPASTIGNKPAVYRCDMTYNGQTYTDSVTIENKIEFTVSDTAPEDPGINDVWLNKADGVRQFLFWDGSEWLPINDYAKEIETVKTEQAQILQEASNITLQHLSDYAEKTEIAELKQSIITMLSVLEGKIEMRFSTSSEATAQVGDALEAFKNLFYTNINFDQDGMTIGKSDSPFKSKFGNIRLSFLQDNREIAYLSNNKLYITDAEIIGMLTITGEAGSARQFIDQHGDWVLQ